MTVKQELFNSFVKGIGKTIGTTIVIGFIGTVFYMYSNTKLYKSNENTSNHIQMSTINENENENNKNETDNKTNYEELENVVNSKYKELFENLMK